MSAPVTTPERASRPRVAPNAPRHESHWREKSPGAHVRKLDNTVPIAIFPAPPRRTRSPSSCGCCPGEHGADELQVAPATTPAPVPAAAVPAKTYTLPCRDCGAIWAEMCFCAKSDALWKAHLESNKKQSDASKP